MTANDRCIDGSAGSTGETTGRMYTEREVVLRERAAYRRGIADLLNDAVTERSARHRASRTYPLPEINRLRVVTIGTYDFRVCGGELQCRLIENRGIARGWMPSTCKASVVAKLADLVANPVERVPDEETDGEEQDRR